METDNTPMSTPGVAPAETGSQKGSVGALLQATRLRLGVELAAVAETLHIRVAYLEAIEAGNYDALPGGTYAVGFIRSYAEQLGLDGKEMVRRFKLETGAQPQLSPPPANFPKPVKTLGMPVGAILTGVAVAGGLGFAGWYLLSGNDSTTLLPKLPAALNETIDAPAPPVAPEAAKPVEPPKPEVAKPEPPKPETVKPVEPPKPEAAAPAPVAPPKPEAAKPVEPPKPAPVAPPKPEAAPPAEPAKPVAEAPKPVVEAPKPPAPPAPPPRPNVEDTADAAPVGPETVARSARVYGEENTGARVELVATADAWVQVTEKGSLVLTRLLHAGDRFRVPNRPGLTLMTGNAGGLDVVVDGGKIAPLGNPGQVVRDVPLDPERLRSGR